MANEIHFKNLHVDKLWTLPVYESVGGYATLRKTLLEKTPHDKIIDDIGPARARRRRIPDRVEMDLHAVRQ